MNAPSSAEIAAFRERHGLTLDSLAALLGVDRMTVWRWEAGRRAPPAFLRLALDRLAWLRR